VRSDIASLSVMPASGQCNVGGAVDLIQSATRGMRRIILCARLMVVALMPSGCLVLEQDIDDDVYISCRFGLEGNTDRLW
jgi:hypothetical protein